jgi:AbrB family looped-hinge helix DNA binding protein
MIIRVSTRGRIVIPASMRRKLGIKSGTRVWIQDEVVNGHITMKPITRESIHLLRGKYKEAGLLKVLISEGKAERDL